MFHFPYVTTRLLSLSLLSFWSTQEQNEAEREILAKMKAEDLQSILNLKKKQEGLIDPEFGARHRAFDIPNFDEVSTVLLLLIQKQPWV